MTHESPGHTRGWGLLLIVLGIESFGGVLLVWLTLRQLLSPSQDLLTQSISIFLMVLVSVAWIMITFVAAVRKRTWARGSNLTLQILVLAAAVGVLQGILGTPLIGSLLLVLAVLGIIGSLLIRPVDNIAQKPEL